LCARALKRRGYAAATYVGQIFPLWGSAATVVPASIPTKAPPKPVSTYSSYLDLSAHLGFADDQIGGFTDSVGFVRGTERIKELSGILGDEVD
jgi:hypothetical protein